MNDENEKLRNELLEVEQVNDDPASWEVTEELIRYILKKGFNQNIKNDFSSSKLCIYNRDRFMSKSIFYRQLANGEKQLRTWLIYSESGNAVFFGPCKLFNVSVNDSLVTGYND